MRPLVECGEVNERIDEDACVLLDQHAVVDMAYVDVMELNRLAEAGMDE